MPTRRNIFDPLQDIRRELDDVFDRVLGEGFMPRMAQPMERGTIAPQIDICLEDDTLRIDADLPGVDPENIECTLKEGVLTIRGERREERTEGDGGLVRERRFGRFERRVTLPEGIDEENLEARFDKGVLTITARMKPGIGQPRRIQIAGAGAGQQSGRQQQTGQQSQPGSQANQADQTSGPAQGSPAGQQPRSAGTQ